MGGEPIPKRITALLSRPEDPKRPCGISPAFAGLSPTRRYVIHLVLTSSPLYSPPEGNFRARLACLIHAASVRSEPGSNSPKVKLSRCVCLLALNLNGSEIISSRVPRVKTTELIFECLNSLSLSGRPRKVLYSKCAPFYECDSYETQMNRLRFIAFLGYVAFSNNCFPYSAFKEQSSGPTRQLPLTPQPTPPSQNFVKPRNQPPRTQHLRVLRSTTLRAPSRTPRANRFTLGARSNYQPRKRLFSPSKTFLQAPPEPIKRLCEGGLTTGWTRAYS
jgi:hypothetical protein